MVANAHWSLNSEDNITNILTRRMLTSIPGRELRKKGPGMKRRRMLYPVEQLTVPPAQPNRNKNAGVAHLAFIADDESKLYTVWSAGLALSAVRIIADLIPTEQGGSKRYGITANLLGLGRELLATTWALIWSSPLPNLQRLVCISLVITKDPLGETLPTKFCSPKDDCVRHDRKWKGYIYPSQRSWFRLQTPIFCSGSNDLNRGCSYLRRRGWPT